MDLRPQEWFHTLRKEYLQRFIGQGGSSVKFVVTPDDIDRTGVQTQLAILAEQEGYACVSVDSKETKIHMMDKFFHQVARRIQWDDLASQFVRRLLQENGYQIPDSRADFCMAGIARMNERAEPLLRRDLNSWLERAIYRDTQMCQEFRMAMIRLCLGQMDSGSESPKNGKMFCFNISNDMKGRARDLEFKSGLCHSSWNFFLRETEFLNRNAHGEWVQPAINGKWRRSFSSECFMIGNQVPHPLTGKVE